jgi:hypothetical protein
MLVPEEKIFEQTFLKLSATRYFIAVLYQGKGKS